MNYKVLIGLVFIVLIYSVLGGVIFHFLESSHEEQTQVDIDQYIQQFQSNFTCLSADDVTRLLTAVRSAYDSGVLSRSDATSDQSNWDYGSAIFFSITVITTIGYGHISPATSGGRVFCSIFALIGIPLFLITVGGLGEKLRKLTQKIQDKATCKSLEHKPKAVKGLTTLLVLLIGFILFVVIPACIFLAIESWAYREAMYYVFITLTTIGFGDYVPGQSENGSYRALYQMGVSIWIFIGLTWMAGVINAVQDLLSEATDKVSSKVSNNEDDETDKKDKLDEGNDTTKTDSDKATQDKTIA